LGEEPKIKAVTLHVALHRAVQKHEFEPADFVAWANRRGIFAQSKRNLLLAGVYAWFQMDYFKAFHIIIPQIESALRQMVDVVGKPTTKAASTVPGISVSINMSDILFNQATTEALGPMGPHLALYLKSIYADPRGMNLRNEFAHGLLDADEVNEWTTLWLIHTLLVMGLWETPQAA